MSCKKKRILKTVSVTDIGCNSCNRLPNLSSIFFNPFPKRHTRLPAAGNYIPCHSSAGESATPTTTSSSSSSARAAVPADADCRWLSDSTTSSYSSPFCGGSTSKKASAAAAIAVEKESDDPYLDFRQSMLQMVLENHIYSKNDLRELLNCFLRLNAPYHHEIIVRAFSDIWYGVFSGAAAHGDSPLLG